MEQRPSSRRIFLKTAGVTAITTAAQASIAASAVNAPQHSDDSNTRTYIFFNPDEARFIEAAVARLIPNDALGPGAVEADVPFYIDRQLGGAWGAGERLYRSGPWTEGAVTQGYQLPLTPAELFRTALRGVQQELSGNGSSRFDQLKPLDQDAYLTTLQNGQRDLNGVPSKVFFESLWAMTIEGYFSDPAYGGNRDMAAWRMIGFPGAYANYYHLVDQHGIAFKQAPMSLAQNGRGHVHHHPNISAETLREKS